MTLTKVALVDWFAYSGESKRHALCDIKSLIEQEAIHALNFEEMFEDVKIGNGATRKSPIYILDIDATMILITGYDANRRAMVIKRWRELDTGEATPAFQLPTSLPEALRLAVHAGPSFARPNRRANTKKKALCISAGGLISYA